MTPQERWEKFTQEMTNSGFVPTLEIHFKESVLDGMKSHEKLLFSQLAQLYFTPMMVFKETGIVVEEQKPIPVEPV